MALTTSSGPRCIWQQKRVIRSVSFSADSSGLYLLLHALGAAASMPSRLLHLRPSLLLLLLLVMMPRDSKIASLLLLFMLKAATRRPPSN